MRAILIGMPAQAPGLVKQVVLLPVQGDYGDSRGVGVDGRSRCFPVGYDLDFVTGGSHVRLEDLRFEPCFAKIDNEWKKRSHKQ